MVTRKEIHDRVLNAASKEELARAYRDWADQYDDDLINGMGYVAPELAARLFHEYLPNESTEVLDAGCGTGLVGEWLSTLGCKDLTGIDYSRQMLQKAAEKKVYSRLEQADLNNLQNIADNSFGGVISVGAFTSGHVGPQALTELVRVTKPGGIICFTVRESAWDDDSYTDTVQEMEQRGMWQLVEEKKLQYILQEASFCQTCVYRVLPWSSSPANQ